MAGDRLDDALREAIGYHLLMPAPGDHRQVAVRHMLIGEAVVAGLLPGEAERLHRMLAVALESRPEWGGETGLEQASRLAGHLLAIGEDLRAVPAIIRAADSSRLALAFADAHQAYQLVLAIVGDGPSPLPAEDWVRVLGNAAATARLVGAAELAVTIQGRLVACVDATADTEGASMARAQPGALPCGSRSTGEAQDVLEAASRGVTD